MKSPARAGVPDTAKVSAIRAMNGKRERLLSPLATTSEDAVRRHNRTPEDIRTPYSRDADRIIHTRAYTRYIDKTQVFYLVENDHITHRVIHVQLVSKIARTIGRSLRLNEDLIEAIALGHDIGHIPYGHFGETCLSALCERYGIGKFFHNVQSVRFLDQIEDCDLTMQVLDGILCHNGEADDLRVTAEPCSGWAAFDKKVQDNADGRRSRSAMTLEGCVVKFADTIAYIGRDLQDAREVGLIGEGTQIPEEARAVLGEANRDIINTLIYDLLENSDTEDDGFISYSRGCRDGPYLPAPVFPGDDLRSPVPHVRTGKDRADVCNPLRDLPPGPGSRQTGMPGYSPISLTPAGSAAAYLDTATPAELVRDFLAGMTDRYFAKRYEECVIPRRVEGRFR